MREECRYRIGEIDEGEQQQSAFNGPVRAVHYGTPNQQAAGGHGNVLTHSKDAKSRCQSGELSGNIAEISQTQNSYCEKSDAQAELFPDQIR